MNALLNSLFSTSSFAAVISDDSHACRPSLPAADVSSTPAQLVFDAPCFVSAKALTSSCFKFPLDLIDEPTSASVSSPLQSFHSFVERTADAFKNIAEKIKASEETVQVPVSIEPIVIKAGQTLVTEVNPSLIPPQGGYEREFAELEVTSTTISKPVMTVVDGELNIDVVINKTLEAVPESRSGNSMMMEAMRNAKHNRGNQKHNRQHNDNS